MKNYIKENWIWMTGILVVAVCIYGGGVVVWHSYCVEARLTNERMGTHYTCKDYFWAEKAINAINQGVNLSK